MKHLIWLTPGFAADETDSKCIPPLQLLAQQLAQQVGLRLHIITLHYPFRQQSYRWRGIDVYPAYQAGRLAKARIWWRAWSYLQKLTRQYPAAQLHSFWLNDAALLGHWASKRFGLTHWITLMGQDARPSNRYLKLFPLSQLQLITLSPFHDEQLFRSTSRRGDRMIPWGIAPISAPPASSPRNIDVLGVGNLIPLKEYSTFVRIIAKMREHAPNIRATLIGDGPERPALERLAQELGVTQNIRFTGYLDRFEVLEYMQRSRVLLHPSTYESFGYVFLEALASGMSVVSRSVGIAQANERWIVAETEATLQAGMDYFSAYAGNTNSLRPWPLEDTVDAYLSILD